MKVLFQLILAIIALFTASKVTKQLTGKHIHEHVLELWGRLRDRVQAWASANHHIRVVKFMASIDERVAGRMTRLKVDAHAHDGQHYEACQQILTLEQAFELCPSLRTQQRVDITQELRQ